MPSAATLGAIAAIGLLSTALAYAIYFRLLTSVGPTNLMLVTLLVPLSATGLGFLFLGERPGPMVFAGMVLILAGLAAIDGRVPRLFSPSRAAR
jgi:drug/metabolite transporter (DMT)-like permease